MLASISNVFFSLHFDFRNGTNKTEANPFEEEEWDEGDADNALVDNGEPGVPVKALYDYDGAESDELTFKQGMKEISNFLLNSFHKWYNINCSIFFFR